MIRLWHLPVVYPWFEDWYEDLIHYGENVNHLDAAPTLELEGNFDIIKFPTKIIHCYLIKYLNR